MFGVVKVDVDRVSMVAVPSNPVTLDSSWLPFGPRVAVESFLRATSIADSAAVNAFCDSSSSLVTWVSVADLKETDRTIVMMVASNITVIKSICPDLFFIVVNC